MTIDQFETCLLTEDDEEEDKKRINKLVVLKTSLSGSSSLEWESTGWLTDWVPWEDLPTSKRFFFYSLEIIIPAIIVQPTIYHIRTKSCQSKSFSPTPSLGLVLNSPETQKSNHQCLCIQGLL